MKSETTNLLPEQHKPEPARRVLGLGLSAVLVAPVFGLITSFLRILLDPVSVNPDAPINLAGGFAGVVVSIMLAFATIVIGFRAVKDGERSWMVWAGMIVAFLAGGFWVLLIAFNLLYSY